MRTLGKLWRITESLESTPSGDLLSVMLASGSGAATAKELLGVSTLKDLPPSHFEFSNCARLESVYFEKGSSYLIYDCTCDRSLGADIEYQSITFEQGLPIAQQVLRGLVELHGAQIVHGRLCPDTCLVAKDNSVKLTEYGLKELWDSPTESELPYLDPKLVAVRDRTFESDCYAFGVLLYKMATGTLPFEVASIEALKTRPTALPPPSGKRATNWPPQTFAFIDRCLTLDPKSRLRTSAELLGHLQRISGSTFGSRSVVAQPVKVRKRKNTGINFVHRNTTGRASVISRLAHSPLIWGLGLIIGALVILKNSGSLNQGWEKLATFFKFNSAEETNAIEMLPIGVYQGSIELNGKASDLRIQRAVGVTTIAFANCSTDKVDSVTGYFPCGTDDAFLDLDGAPQNGKINGNITLRGKQHQFSATKSPQ